MLFHPGKTRKSPSTQCASRALRSCPIVSQAAGPADARARYPFGWNTWMERSLIGRYFHRRSESRPSWRPTEAGTPITRRGSHHATPYLALPTAPFAPKSRPIKSAPAISLRQRWPVRRALLPGHLGCARRSDGAPRGGARPRSRAASGAALRPRGAARCCEGIAKGSGERTAREGRREWCDGREGGGGARHGAKGGSGCVLSRRAAFGG